MSIGKLDKGSPIPLYHQVKEILLAAIESGQLIAEQQLPTETQLAEQFGVSKITVRQALTELASGGYVRREQGRGTFVERPSFGQGPRELTSFTEEMRSHHLAPSSRVLDQKEIEADDSTATALDIPAGSKVFLLKRLRLAGGEPMGIQTAHLDLALTPGIADLNFENVSLYDVLERTYGLEPVRARETYCVGLAKPEVAELLAIPAGSPVLQAERVTLSSGGRPFEFVRSVMRGDRYRIVLDLVKDRARHSA